MNGRYLTLAGRIRRDLKDLETVVQRSQDIWKQYETSQNDQFLDAVALNLHSFYTGIERILESIAEISDGYQPTGKSWHRELLLQLASEVSGIRPPVLSDSLLKALDQYRGFRHVVRNIYTFRLEANQISPLIDQLSTTYQNCQIELLQFADFLEETGTST
ncbi:ribonuclease toxin HepT-like protein [Dactylococcopsis salina]|uniref:HepT-like domain-containing protein n=1 Tax=Dactylococcopsis salina (strain PCC 8305) TaxID=13035 RepID=K9YV78_DACS8|nr:hypothetical protein [Dactylococcopsis salina]AFZ50826.1 hypothetical protein Dacsa_2206 [Dactylococcopsis salina PCC 8305]